MEYGDYKEYVSAETMMGPNSLRLLKELLDRYPPNPGPEDEVLDLGCGTGLTSLVVARETGAHVIADDLWVSEADNAARFQEWGVRDRVTPVHADANELPFEQGRFSAIISIDAYHYFAGREGFFQQKLLPLLKEGGMALIGIPGLKDAYEGRAETLLSGWLGEDAHLFKSPGRWRRLIGANERIVSVDTWEMGCFEQAWGDWLSADHPFAKADAKHFESIIQPYTCFVGICVKLK